MELSRATLVQGFADLSINLASAWLGVILVSPGVFGVTTGQWFGLLTFNLPPAIIVFVIGLVLLEKRSKL